MNKQICVECARMAVWFYMPNDKIGPYCDHCVPRGCSCNFYPPNNDLDSGEDWIEDLDEFGRKWPCCEYSYLEEGEFVE